MPIYEYICTTCDHRADILLGINDPGPEFCLSCGAEGTMRKLFSSPAIHFKGSGWAKKDRGGTSATKAANAAAKAADHGSGAGSGGSSSGDAPATSPTSGDAKPASPSGPAKPASSGEGTSTSGSGD